MLAMHRLRPFDQDIMKHMRSGLPRDGQSMPERFSFGIDPFGARLCNVSPIKERLKRFKKGGAHRLM